MEVKRVPISQVKKADWNPKYDSDYLKEKLKNSILFEDSPGVLAVRELENGDYEVIDGNHRLEVLQELGYEEVWIEDLGKLDDKQALMVFWQRNEIWFPIKYDIAIPTIIERDLVEIANETSPREIRVTPRKETVEEEPVEVSVEVHLVTLKLEGEVLEWLTIKADEDQLPVTEEVMKIVRDKIDVY